MLNNSKSAGNDYIDVSQLREAHSGLEFIQQSADVTQSGNFGSKAEFGHPANRAEAQMS